jgi:hypothetical protein
MHLARTLGLNCQGLLDNCHRVQLRVLHSVLQAQQDLLFGGVDQFQMPNWG